MNNAIQLKAADAFASAHGYSASVVRLRNTSDVSIDYSVSGGDAVELAAGASAVVDVAALTSEISVRRTDLSTTPVDVMLEFGLDPDEAYVFAVENAPGSTSGPVAAADITDAGTAGIAVLQAETPEQGRTALGFGGTIITNIDEDYETPELTQDTKLYFAPSEDRTCDITAGAASVGTKLFLYHSGSGNFKETVTYATGKSLVMTQKMFYELEKVPDGWLFVRESRIGQMNHGYIIPRGAVELAGQLRDKDALWHYITEYYSSLIVTEAEWQYSDHSNPENLACLKFANYSDTQYRLPDWRGITTRYAGANSVLKKSDGEAFNGGSVLSVLLDMMQVIYGRLDFRGGGSSGVAPIFVNGSNRGAIEIGTGGDSTATIYETGSSNHNGWKVAINSAKSENARTGAETRPVSGAEIKYIYVED